MANNLLTPKVAPAESATMLTVQSFNDNLKDKLSFASAKQMLKLKLKGGSKY